jgi:hypothetical protein
MLSPNIHSANVKMNTFCIRHDLILCIAADSLYEYDMRVKLVAENSYC